MRTVRSLCRPPSESDFGMTLGRKRFQSSPGIWGLCSGLLGESVMEILRLFPAHCPQASQNRGLSTAILLFVIVIPNSHAGSGRGRDLTSAYRADAVRLRQFGRMVSSH